MSERPCPRDRARPRGDRRGGEGERPRARSRRIRGVAARRRPPTRASTSARIASTRSARPSVPPRRRRWRPAGKRPGATFIDRCTWRESGSALPGSECRPAEPAVVIDPGRAFGTGAHATTRLCVELLARIPRGSLLDVGCGSGVLSIAAARLGYGPVSAVDDDPVAVEVTRANAAVNGVAVDARVLDATVGAAAARRRRGREHPARRRRAGPAPHRRRARCRPPGYLAGERPVGAGMAAGSRVEQPTAGRPMRSCALRPEQLSVHSAAWQRRLPRP